jgi:hypothetical protein
MTLEEYLDVTVFYTRACSHAQDFESLHALAERAEPVQHRGGEARGCLGSR